MQIITQRLGVFMIQDFETIKKQLGELANEINKFKSEAVQLRLVELIFGTKSSEEEADFTTRDEPPAAHSTRSRRPRKRKAKSKPGPTIDNDGSPKKGPEKKRRTSTSGSLATLTDLYNAGFFKERRTIGAISKHCSEKLALNFKSNELSPGLIRMVRNQQLDREKNTDGQFEYFEQ
jgi:hypothetical protein